MTTRDPNESELSRAYIQMLQDCKEVKGFVGKLADTCSGGEKAGLAAATALPVQPSSLDATVEEEQHQKEVWEKVCSTRRAKVRFHAVRPGPNPEKCSLNDVYKPTGKLMQAFQSTRSTNWESKNQMRAFVICADTWDYHSQASAASPLEPNEELQRLLSWLAPHKDNNTMVILFDGRSKKYRRKFEDWLAEHYPDEMKQCELWITYAGLTAGPGNDPRDARRKVAFADNNREAVLVGLPVPKHVIKSKPRSTFGACGEVSTHSQTYSGVPKRKLVTLPRLQPLEKQAMLGVGLADLPERCSQSGLAGHPLFWQEVKSVGILSQVLSDLGVAHVVDLSCGSGAVATAAAINHITYDGFCFNEMQQSWLDGVMDRMMLYLLTDKVLNKETKQDVDQQFAESIRKYFAASIADVAKLVGACDETVTDAKDKDKIKRSKNDEKDKRSKGGDKDKGQGEHGNNESDSDMSSQEQ